MILGDRAERVSSARLQASVSFHLKRAVEAPAVATARAALIAAGQFEQAMADDHFSSGTVEVAMQMTDALATAFVIACCATGGWAGEIRQVLENALALFDALEERWEWVDAKVPEGFAFYALFPEQYIHAARRWASCHNPGEGPVLVVGVRSIGTTLSAVVQARLRRAGYEVRRCTVRPEGHPFDRKAALPPGTVAGAAWALVVDEGPGFSGSSMASLALACERDGMPYSRLAFLPGHTGQPGAAASKAVRACWKTMRVYYGHPPDLQARLVAASERLFNQPVTCVEEFGGGRWRPLCFTNSGEWPVSNPLLERMKFRCTFGDSTALLWKFAGLPGVLGQNADADFRLLQLGWAGGWTPEPVASCDGFVATLWVPGEPVTEGGATPEFLAHLAEYLVLPSGEWVTEEEARRAHERLGPMIQANLARGVGSDLAACAVELWRRARPMASSLCADPQLALHEWIRTPEGAFVKTDSTGHLCDHTLLGRQPVEWGWAAACNECGLSEAALGIERPLEAERLHAYRLAHAAFRLGQLELAETTAPQEELPRIARESERVCGLVRRLLGNYCLNLNPASLGDVHAPLPAQVAGG